MPFKSKAQMRYFFAAEKEGKLPTGTARRWAHESKDAGVDLKKLPEKKKEESSGNRKMDKKEVLAKIKEKIKKEATVGTNTANALAKPKKAISNLGVKVPSRQVIGRSKAFDPKESLLSGPKNK